ncbi:GNAT family N-acetyltransferase [Carboxydochorda subterranea]|uniref:GNAT family N-acetyltransferase n=1 Tax=Carboxydichorda subterranea TaxID=3109565 RepID=A0ABZ1C4B3_9FIRM|nr:GNAT family N-acetyltransferase [Limnochorda sp. L945t]WRP18877.1 GNAT family N-acetyltransferase [Limnochorda sp. L945t]
MRVVRLQSAGEFLALAGAFLLQHEAEHHLMLGVAGELARGPGPSEAPPYLAAVVKGDRVLAAALMTPPRNLLLSRFEAPDAPELSAPDAPELGALDAPAPAEPLALIADDLAGGGWAVPGVLAPSPLGRRFAELWQARTGIPFRPGMAQRIYALVRREGRPVRAPAGVPGRLRRATEEDRELLVRWVTAFAAEALPQEPPDAARAQRLVDGYLQPGLQPERRGMVLWEDGQPPRPVSMAAFTGPTPNGIRVQAVYTPPELRRRGYASACVAALSQWLLDSGYRACFLFTDRSNATSNHIYQAIGYAPVCDADEFRFGAAGAAAAGA